MMISCLLAYRFFCAIENFLSLFPRSGECKKCNPSKCVIHSVIQCGGLFCSLRCLREDSFLHCNCLKFFFPNPTPEKPYPQYRYQSHFMEISHQLSRFSSRTVISSGGSFLHPPRENTNATKEGI